MTRIDQENNSDVWLKAFFDGGTLWNDARQSVNEDGETVFVLEDYPGIEIEVIFEEIAVRRSMAFPEQISNFDSCEVRAAMCYWTQDRQANDDNGNCEEPYDVNCVDADPADNTDICLVDMERAPQSGRVEAGFAIFPEDSEGDTHCHGFAWSEDEEDPSNQFKGNVLFFVSMFDHLYQRGYVKNVPGAPMCACVEQVSTISTFFQHTLRFLLLRSSKRPQRIDRLTHMVVLSSYVYYNHTDACRIPSRLYPS
jgi:hypothetical protein